MAAQGADAAGAGATDVEVGVVARDAGFAGSAAGGGGTATGARDFGSVRRSMSIDAEPASAIFTVRAASSLPGAAKYVRISKQRVSFSAAIDGSAEAAMIMARKVRRFMG
jgi:hypothetical protein